MWPISAAFKQAIQSPVHTVKIKMQVLDTDGHLVPDGEFHEAGSKTAERVSERQLITDGSVDVDTSRGARRTMTVTLLNPGGVFSPNSEWAGTFYVDRMIRLWRGVRYSDEDFELVPIGTFYIDTADVVAERNMSIVTISGSDGWKKFTKAKFGKATKYAEGTSVNTVIRDMADLCGVDKLNLDPLDGRSASTSELQKDMHFERSDNVGEALLKLGNDFSLDIYFDPMGRLTTEPLKSPSKSPVVWRYEPEQDGALLMVRATFKDDRLYNNVVVTGTADEKNPVHGRASDNDPDSPTNIDRIGRRTYEYESKHIKTVDQAKETAKKLLLKHLQRSEDIELQAICNPAYEGNDVIRVEEQDFTKLDHRYRIHSFTIPLSSARQSLKLARTIELENA